MPKVNPYFRIMAILEDDVYPEIAWSGLGMLIKLPRLPRTPNLPKELLAGPIYISIEIPSTELMLQQLTEKEKLKELLRNALRTIYGSVDAKSTKSTKLIEKLEKWREWRKRRHMHIWNCTIPAVCVNEQGVLEICKLHFKTCAKPEASEKYANMSIRECIKDTHTYFNGHDRDYLNLDVKPAEVDDSLVDAVANIVTPYINAIIALDNAAETARFDDDYLTLETERTKDVIEIMEKLGEMEKSVIGLLARKPRRTNN